MTNPNPQFSPQGHNYDKGNSQPNYANLQQAYSNPQNTQMPNAAYVNAGTNASIANGPFIQSNAQPFSPQFDVAAAKRTTIGSVYLNMALGVLLTAVIAFLSAGFGWLGYFLLAVGQFGFIALLIAQVVLVIVLAARVMKMSPTAARVLFYVYAATMGFTLSEVFYVYNLGSIVIAFGITAVFFFILTMLARTTTINMLKAGPILMVALVVLIISQVVLMFVPNITWLTQLVCALGIIVFAGFTLYDTKKTAILMQQNAGDELMLKRVGIICALNLYLDFVNLFLYILRILGAARN